MRKIKTQPVVADPTKAAAQLERAVASSKRAARSAQAPSKVSKDEPPKRKESP